MKAYTCEHCHGTVRGRRNQDEAEVRRIHDDTCPGHKRVKA